MRIAAYARYSSDNQRDASLEDQLRNCRRYAERQDWRAPEEFADRAISGSRTDRAEYSRLLAAADRFDVILVDDLSRLGRDKDEIGRTVKRLTFLGVRLIGVSDGVDTARKSSKLDVGMRGLMSELYLDDLADKTHRGLTGRALAGASAGGLPYGYRVACTGQRTIDEGQAKVVRRIFALYLDGYSPRKIVSALNADAVPSARGGTWALTAVSGDVRRGIGILCNPIYIGRQIWNRSQWVKHPDTGRRVRKERPESEWIISDVPELAIIDQDTWNRAQARLHGRKNDYKRGVGTNARYLLSGILRCHVCGGPVVSIDRYQYGCATHKSRGDAACASRLTFKRRDAEAAVLAGIKQQLLGDAAYNEFQKRVTAALKSAQPDTGAHQQRLAKAERERDNIMAAIRDGILTPSTKADLERAERAIEDCGAALVQAKAFQPSQILPRAREVWKRLASTLETTGRDIPATREAIKEIVGSEIVVYEKGADLVAEIRAFPGALPHQIDVVAGAGFEPATFGL